MIDRFIWWMASREPNMVIGGRDNPYLLRWYVIPRNPFFNVYLHQFLRDDDDRALHDHPWVWCSIILRGRYIEHTMQPNGVPAVQAFGAGSIRFHRPTFAHRLALIDAACCWTLFITGPRIRNWGFWCKQGWRPWQVFTSAEDPGSVGRGCN